MSGAGQRHDQWIRKVSLIVENDNGQGLDLSALRVHFRVNESEFETPNNAEITVYNLSTNTAQKVRKEFTKVVLQAGYKDGSFGIIFQGTIKQSKIGRESQTDTFLKIFSSDSDELYNFGMANLSLDAGTTPRDQIAQVAKAMGATVGYIEFNTALQSNIRGKVLYGMARSQIRGLARTGGAQWSLQNGQLTMIPFTGYLPGEAVVINSRTGMIGLPEQTEEGIKVTTLLNPKIQIGTQVQINESTIQRASVTFGQSDITQFTNGNFPGGARTGNANDVAAIPPVTADGFYFTLVHEMEGDTRDNEYYSFLTCLSVSPSAPAGNSVKAAG